MSPQAILERIGAAPSIIDLVAAEVCTAKTVRAVDREELWAIAIVTTWEALERAKGPGYIRIRVRGALRDAMRREYRALGRMPQVIRWPIYWPRPETPIHLPCRQYAARSGRWYAARRREAAA